MPKKTYPAVPAEAPGLSPNPHIGEDIIPEAPLMPGEDPDIIPDEDPFETPPTEMPPPGEGP
jgi:hypothetical protein